MTGEDWGCSKLVTQKYIVVIVDPSWCSGNKLSACFQKLKLKILKYCCSRVSYVSQLFCRNPNTDLLKSLNVKEYTN